jgi:hypothetical protein
MKLNGRPTHESSQERSALNLKDLIRRTLVQIVEGVKESHEAIIAAGGEVLADKRECEVRFNVLLAASASQADDGVAVLEAKDQPSGPNAETARIEFAVRVKLPTDRERRRPIWKDLQKQARESASRASAFEGLHLNGSLVNDDEDID